ncbi:MAG: hypothetical protein K1X82_04035 [Bacteroidia bacterium]|nr:hypothetical protein [Bacteroidia bacterium]
MTIESIHEQFGPEAQSDIDIYDGYFVFLRKDGIMQIQYFKDQSYGVEDARKILDSFRKLGGGERRKVLAIYHHNNLFDQEVMKLIGSEEVTRPLVKADALVTNSLALKILINGYFHVVKTPRPIRIFNNKDEAVTWLHGLTIE